MNKVKTLISRLSPKKVIKRVRIWIYTTDKMPLKLRNFVEQFIYALAAIASFVTCIALLFQDEINRTGWNFGQKLVILIVIVLICCIYSCFMNQRITKVSFTFNPQFKLTIEKGDIFDKKGIIVIPVNEYFDTHVGDGIISPTSVHGKWINKYFANDIRGLEQIISNELLRINAPIKANVARPPAKSDKYDLGTIIDIQKGDNIYVLVALTHFNQSNHAFVDRDEYSKVFDKLIKYLERMHGNHAVYMPLMGTGLSRLGRTPQRILNFLVDSIDFKFSQLTFPQGFFIEIYDIDSVNLTELETYVNNGITL